MTTIIGLCFSDELEILGDCLNNLQEIYNDLLKINPQDDFQSEEDYSSYQYFIERKEQNLENILGLYFIVAQNFISSVIFITNRYIKQFSKDNPSQREIKKIDLICSDFNDMVPGYNFTKVQAINAIANYYKHKDEWGNKWCDQKNKNQEIVIKLGMKPKNLNNIQSVCDKFIFNNMIISKEIYDLLKSWSNYIESNHDYLIKQT